MTLKIEIEIDNAAFDGRGGGRELARILGNVAKRVGEAQADEWKLLDSNGNTVGKAEVVE